MEVHVHDPGYAGFGLVWAASSQAEQSDPGFAFRVVVEPVLSSLTIHL